MLDCLAKPHFLQMMSIKSPFDIHFLMINKHRFKRKDI